MKSVAARPAFGAGLTLLLLLALTGLLYLPYLDQMFWGMDEGVAVVYPDLILRGYQPYRDIAMLYTPGSYYLLAWAFKLFQVSVQVERWLGWVYWLLLVWAFYRLGRMVSASVAVLAPLGALLVLQAFGVGAYAIVVALGLGLLGFQVAMQGLYTHPLGFSRQVLLAGVLCGLTLWMRQDIGGVVIVTVLVVYLAGVRQCIRPLLAGLAVALLPGVLLLAQVGWSVMWVCLVTDVARSMPGRNLPLIWSWPVAGLLLGVLLNALLAVSIWRSRPQSPDPLFSLGLALLALLLLPSGLQRADLWHLIYIGTPVAGLLVLQLGLWFKLRSGTALEAAWFQWVALGLLLVFMIHEFYGVQTRERFPLYPVASGERVDLVSDQQTQQETQQLIHLVNQVAQPGARLFIGPVDLRFANYNDTYLYYFFPQFKPATRYVELNPGIANRPGSGWEVELAGADVVILTSRYVGFKEPNASQTPGPDVPNQVLRQDFCLRGQVGLWYVLTRCKR